MVGDGGEELVTRIDDAAIAERAYQIWLAEGRPPGRSAEHWMLARALLLAEAEQLGTHPFHERVRVRRGRLQHAPGGGAGGGGGARRRRQPAYA